MLQQKIKSYLSTYPTIKLALLFGSQALGLANKDSDVDLGIICDKPIDATFKLKIIADLGLFLGRPIDLVDLYYAPEPILGQALQGIRLIGDNSTYAQLLTKHIFNTADFLPLRQRILQERQSKWIK